jgi:hypothetical protein
LCILLTVEISEQLKGVVGRPGRFDRLQRHRFAAAPERRGACGLFLLDHPPQGDPPHRQTNQSHSRVRRHSYTPRHPHRTASSRATSQMAKGTARCLPAWVNAGEDAFSVCSYACSSFCFPSFLLFGNEFLVIAHMSPLSRGVYSTRPLCLYRLARSVLLLKYRGPVAGSTLLHV